MVSDVTITQAAQQSARTSDQQAALATDFNDFLILLTTQIQNQDPLQPMDSTEFTNQLVQFSQVEQQINSNQKLDSLVNLQLANTSGLALGFVGLEITYPSVEMNFDGERPVRVTYVSPEDAISAEINIRDEEGNLVFTQEVDGSTGSHEFVWDGEHLGGGVNDSGTYEVSIDAFDIDDEPIAINTAVNGIVHGIETQNGVPFLLVGERAIQLNNVIKTEQPRDLSALSDTSDTADNNTEESDEASS